MDLKTEVAQVKTEVNDTNIDEYERWLNKKLCNRFLESEDSGVNHDEINNFHD